ncbi:hypothetical protein F5144DRAFT_488157 [Chaetomium tenue]|uniref:Uncharacterized protein n=1 Tax=Chaetomium tenue TaxID=1854479 RepID=A0ACB7PBW4_9PEZI|nr:hypothetical protein F5144DRAFT_488157 [Chaetomium globosum]
MLLKLVLALVSLAALVVAAPATEPDTGLSQREALEPFTLAEPGDTLKARDLTKRDAINISMFGGNGCTGQVHGISQIGGAPTCYPVPASKRSIHTWGDYARGGHREKEGFSHFVKSPGEGNYSSTSVGHGAGGVS